MPKSVKNSQKSTSKKSSTGKKSAVKSVRPKAAAADKIPMDANTMQNIQNLERHGTTFKNHLHTLGATDPGAEKPTFRNANFTKAAALVDEAVSLVKKDLTA